RANEFCSSFFRRTSCFSKSEGCRGQDITQEGGVADYNLEPRLRLINGPDGISRIHDNWNVVYLIFPFQDDTSDAAQCSSEPQLRCKPRFSNSRLSFDEDYFQPIRAPINDFSSSI